jgi:isocitrate dehydrogenase
MFSFKKTATLFRPATLARYARLMSGTSKITYTLCDEAPALATYSFLPVVARFAKDAGVVVVTSDISLAGRIIANFPDFLQENQRQPDALAELGELCKRPEANIIKTPNISASIPQLVEAIAELREKGYNVPLYPSNPTNEEEKAIKARYSKILGSAVNPVLREGNSDRRVAAPVKAFAQKHPHKLGAWNANSKTHVAHMTSGDFYSSEKSVVVTNPTSVKIEHIAADGTATVLKAKTDLLAGEVIDGSFISYRQLSDFYEREINDAREQGLLLSLHLKATMMKVSDPVMFGACVKVFYKDAFAKNQALFDRLKVNPNNGLGDVYEKIATLPAAEKAQVEADIQACYASRPAIAMVNSAQGITNLHVPSDVIVDASMPCVVRDSGMMWNKDNKLQETKCLIPDRCYGTTYAAICDFVKEHGQFDVSTMGNVSNVGLMAQKAEEYGSHDKTFQIRSNGKVRVTDNNTGALMFEHVVEEGDIWRMCQTKDIPIRDWVRLAVSRARATGNPTVFWLDPARAHDANIITKVTTYLAEHDTTGLDISIKTPQEAVRFSMERARAGKDTISVTGNVLRDYLTDMFPILELGTSAKMLSIVPLLAGGGLFETGAGGSAPKHVEQFLQEGHLRWDSLGEYLAMAVSLEHLGETTNSPKAKLLSKTLNLAIGRILNNNKSPSRKVKQLDNRGTNYYLGLYWAEFMAKEDPSFKTLADELKTARPQIVAELTAAQGEPVDVGGYYKPDQEKVSRAMRPSPTWNAILDK